MKKNKLILILLAIYFQPLFVYSQSVRLVNKIPIEENALILTGSFVVFKDGNFLLADIKDRNNQFKLINEAGKLIKLRKVGPRPDEYGRIGFVDYSSKYLAAYDAGRQCIHIFELPNNSFQKI